jgi:N-carbamoylputrescine amidase
VKLHRRGNRGDAATSLKEIFFAGKAKTPIARAGRLTHCSPHSFATQHDILTGMIVKIGLIQMSCCEEPVTNLERALLRIREAAARGAQIVCLPELFKSLYFCQREDHECFRLAEEVPGPTTSVMCELARSLEVVLIVPLFERRAPGIYHNAAAVIDADGRYLGKYRKMHIPDDPLYYEKFYFAPGDLGFQAWETRYGRIGVLICWDQWYPEAARLTALRGARILFYPTAIGWHPSEKLQQGKNQHAAWENIQKSHAIANGVFVAAINRMGHEGKPPGGIEFWGASFVSDPYGTVLERAPHDKEQILVSACNLEEVDTVRTHWPFLRDRRLDAYGEINQRFLD